jgi:hypothetical protein
MKKLYLVRVEVNEDCPYYVFLLYANDEKSAEKKAREIAEQDYDYVFDVYVDEIKSLEDVKNLLLIKKNF